MNETNEKTMGQIAYEAFAGAFLPAGSGIPWDDNRENVHAAWEAAAAAVLAQPHMGTMVGGPIEMCDYDYIVLAVDHRIEAAPNAIAFETGLSAGTKLFMVKPEPGAVGLTYQTGEARKAGDWPYNSPGAQDRMDELAAAAKQEGRET